MLPTINQLKNDRDFKKVLKFGTFFGTKNLRAKFLKTTGTIRFGFVIGLKVSKKATVRNRLKRQVREVVRILLKEGLIQGQADIVIHLGSGLIDLEFQEIAEEVNTLLKRGNFLKM